MGVIYVNNIEVFAKHGCQQEEGVIGGKYLVDVSLHLDMHEACRTDELDATVDYVEVARIVRAEMAIRSKLIEAVGYRILKSLERNFDYADNIMVRVTKISPPIPGNVESVSIELRSHH
jgi:dihydroneopterin aldolase